MRTTGCFLTLLLAGQAICGIIRNPPAFSKPVYSDSYLPAAMQVIFHAVEQLKALQSEETTQSSTIGANPYTTPITRTTQNDRTTAEYSSTTIASPTTSAINETKVEEDEQRPMESSNDKVEESKEDQPSEESSTVKIEGTTVASGNKFEQSSNDKPGKPEANRTVEPEESSEKNESKDDKVSEEGESNVKETSGSKVEDLGKSKVNETILEESPADKILTPEMKESQAAGTTEKSMGNPSGHQETPEPNEETPEMNYATPETNYESPEDLHALQETNQEIPEADRERTSPSPTTGSKTEAATASDDIADSIAGVSIVQEVEEKIKEPTIDSVVQGVYEILKPTTSKFIEEEKFGESKSIGGTSSEKLENIEEEDDENRFAQLGEKVTQVPRPSLSSALRRSKVPPSVTLQQLANLYDSLSKDARKQGLGKYTGYSDEVLNTLETSAEGGIGPQLKTILGKVLERNELTREDARAKTSRVVQDLNNPSSAISKELRPLIPLRYAS